jgi:phosphoribosylformylglycinamidine synthase
MKNDHLQFRCDLQSLVVKNNSTPFTQKYHMLEGITLPIAHGEGNYFCDETTLEQLQKNHQIVFTYQGVNPNGSIEDIAGICNDRGNVLGLMPHPERAMYKWMGSDDGYRFFTSIYEYWEEKHRVFSTSS